MEGGKSGCRAAGGCVTSLFRVLQLCAGGASPSHFSHPQISEIAVFKSYLAFAQLNASEVFIAIHLNASDT